MVKKNTKKSKVKTLKPKNNGTFCTECDTDLDEFCFTAKAVDKKAVLKNHEKCVKKGKFSGEFCSKMFISSDSMLDEIWEDKE